jgi:hypothetical protein
MQYICASCHEPLRARVPQAGATPTPKVGGEQHCGLWYPRPRRRLPAERERRGAADGDAGACGRLQLRCLPVRLGGRCARACTAVRALLPSRVREHVASPLQGRVSTVLRVRRGERVRAGPARPAHAGAVYATRRTRRFRRRSWTRRAWGALTASRRGSRLKAAAHARAAHAQGRVGCLRNR